MKTSNTNSPRIKQKICMEFIELLIRSSMHVLVSESDDKFFYNPSSFGSGCIVFYRNKYFFITVDHVIHVEDHENNSTQMNALDKNVAVYTEEVIDLQMGLKPLGGIYHFEIINIHKNDDFSKIDFAFCEISQADLQYFKQESIDIENIVSIPKSTKIPLIIDSILKPDIKKEFAVCGRIKPRISGMRYHSQLAVYFGLTFRSDCGEYYILDYKPLSNDSIELWRGISGAPVLENTGKPIGLIARVNVDSKVVFVISMEKCKSIIDMTLKVEEIGCQ